MAIQDYSTLVKGATVVWKNTGGDKTLNGKNLTNTSIRQGDKSASLVNATSGIPELLGFTFETMLQSAPTAGKEFSLYLGWSSSSTAATDNPAGLGGADASGPNSDALPQLTFAGSIIMSNNIGTGIQRQGEMVVRPLKEFVIPVIDNETGQTTTNVDGQTLVTMTPWYRVRQS